MVIVIVPVAEEVESLAWLGVLVVTLPGTLVSAIEAVLSVRSERRNGLMPQR